MQRMPDLTLLTPVVPYPPRSGGTAHILRTTEQLARHAHNVRGAARVGRVGHDRREHGEVRHERRSKRLSILSGCAQAIRDSAHMVPQYALKYLGRHGPVGDQYKDQNGVVSSVYQDDIILDVLPPQGRVIIVPAGGARKLASAGVTLQLSASDDVSGVAEMRVSSQSSFYGASWQPYATSLGDGQQQERVCPVPRLCRECVADL